jgi:hypothetical protein
MSEPRAAIADAHVFVRADAFALRPGARVIVTRTAAAEGRGASKPRSPRCRLAGPRGDAAACWIRL